MIIVIMVKEKNKRSGMWETIASHGVCEETGRTIVLPPMTAQQLWAKYCSEREEWVL